MIFVIQYNRQAGRSVRIDRFDDTDRQQAQDARFALELDLNRRGIGDEVVLLGAPDEAALRRTHARYFESLGEILTRFQQAFGVLAVRERKDP